MFWVGLRLWLLIVDYGRLFAHILGGCWFFFEIVSSVDIFNDALVFVLDIFNLLLQVLKLLVKGFYLFHSSDGAGLADWLGH